MPPGRWPVPGRCGFPCRSRCGWKSGRASLTVPAGRTKTGAVLYDAVPADLLPSGRQMDIAGQWHGPLGKGELRLGAVYSHRPGHNEAADPELTFLGGWRRDF